MAAWDKAYQNPATSDRVKKDAADGKALGVQGTPTFFVNGKKLTPRVWDDLGDAIDAALARRRPHAPVDRSWPVRGRRTP